MKLLRLIFLSGLLALTSCGYTFQGSGSVLPPDVKKIQIPIVENNSTETILTQLVTEALRDQFERYGVVIVVEDVEEADAVLKAKILKVNRKSRTVTSNTDTVQQFDTSMVMSAELRKATGQLLWADPALSITKAVGTSRDLVVSSSADFAGGNLSSSELAKQDTQIRETLDQVDDELSVIEADESHVLLPQGTEKIAKLLTDLNSKL